MYFWIHVLTITCEITLQATKAVDKNAHGDKLHRVAFASASAAAVVVVVKNMVVNIWCLHRRETKSPFGSSPVNWCLLTVNISQMCSAAIRLWKWQRQHKSPGTDCCYCNLGSKVNKQKKRRRRKKLKLKMHRLADMQAGIHFYSVLKKKGWEKERGRKRDREWVQGQEKKRQRERATEGKTERKRVQESKGERERERVQECEWWWWSVYVWESVRPQWPWLVRQASQWKDVK